MALSAWKATAQQSISNSAIQSSVKGMQKKKRRGEKERTWKSSEIFVWADEASTPPAAAHPFFLSFKSNHYFFPSPVIFLGAFRATVRGS